MADRVGVELQRDRLRAVALARFGRSPRATVEVPWDPERPEDGVAALVAQLGRPRRVGLAVGLAFLQVARVTLPPLPAPERKRALALDPARHFPVDAPVAVALLGGAAAADGPEPAFAVPRELLDRWLAAFEVLGTVECVEAAPAAIVRALGASALGDGTYALPAGDGEVGAMEVCGGRVAAARRIPELALDDGAALRPLPVHDGVEGAWLAAWGAALGTNQAAEVQLLDDASAGALGARRRRRVAAAAVACGVALGLTLAAGDRSRARTLARVDAEHAAVEPRAAPAESLVARIAALETSARAADRIAASRPAVLRTLAALGTRLPPDAVVQSVRVQGDAWQVDGVARDAAAVVPALDADPSFADVRAAAPTSRYEGASTVAGAARETFSVTFRAVHARGAR